jgi:hypothetical protein
MSLEGFVIGIIGILLGAAFAFAGLRWFMLLLPLWGAFTGFMVGSGATATLLNEGFLASVIGIVVGIIVAIVFALLSWFYWWGAITVIAGVLGFEVAQWLMVVIGFDASGFVTTVIAVIAGVALAVVALFLNAPKYVAIILTAFAGAAWLTAGVALVFGVIKPDELNGGALVAIYTEGWLWIGIWAVVAAAGIVAQIQMSARDQRDIVALYAARSPM